MLLQSWKYRINTCHSRGQVQQQDSNSNWRWGHVCVDVTEFPQQQCGLPSENRAHPNSHNARLWPWPAETRWNSHQSVYLLKVLFYGWNKQIGGAYDWIRAIRHPEGILAEESSQSGRQRHLGFNPPTTQGNNAANFNGRLERESQGGKSIIKAGSHQD